MSALVKLYTLRSSVKFYARLLAKLYIAAQWQHGGGDVLGNGEGKVMQRQTLRPPNWSRKKLRAGGLSWYNRKKKKGKPNYRSSPLTQDSSEAIQEGNGIPLEIHIMEAWVLLCGRSCISDSKKVKDLKSKLQIQIFFLCPVCPWEFCLQRFGVGLCPGGSDVRSGLRTAAISHGATGISRRGFLFESAHFGGRVVAGWRGTEGAPVLRTDGACHMGPSQGGFLCVQGTTAPPSSNVLRTTVFLWVRILRSSRMTVTCDSTTWSGGREKPAVFVFTQDAISGRQGLSQGHGPRIWLPALESC